MIVSASTDEVLFQRSSGCLRLPINILKPMRTQRKQSTLMIINTCDLCLFDPLKRANSCLCMKPAQRKFMLLFFSKYCK